MFKIFTKRSRFLALGFLLWFIMPAAAETTVSAEVGFIFNTFLIFSLRVPSHVYGSRICNA